jgi:hypothetical protein
LLCIWNKALKWEYVKPVMLRIWQKWVRTSVPMLLKFLVKQLMLSAVSQVLLLVEVSTQVVLHLMVLL